MLGHQLIAQALGGKVSSGATPEYGLTEVRCDPGARMFRGLAPSQTVWMSHGDHVEALPPGMTTTASSDRLGIAAFESTTQPIFGLQFHPEVTHAPSGNGMLANFLSACGAERSWNAGRMVDALVLRIREQAGSRALFLLLSGGVDSLVCLALCVRAVGPERVFSLHVDTGFMRLRESDEIIEAMEALGFKQLAVAHAEPRFLTPLAGVIDPERKREIIGKLFVDVLHTEIATLPLGDDWMLVQGTIYPDTIESGGTQRAARIKTHHNRVEENRAADRAGQGHRTARRPLQGRGARPWPTARSAGPPRRATPLPRTRAGDPRPLLGRRRALRGTTAMVRSCSSWRPSVTSARPFSPSTASVCRETRAPIDTRPRSSRRTASSRLGNR